MSESSIPGGKGFSGSSKSSITLDDLRRIQEQFPPLREVELLVTQTEIANGQIIDLTASAASFWEGWPSLKTRIEKEPQMYMMSKSTFNRLIHELGRDLPSHVKVREVPY